MEGNPKAGQLPLSTTVRGTHKNTRGSLLDSTISDSRAGARFWTNVRGFGISNKHLVRKGWFAVRDVAQLENDKARLSPFGVAFKQRCLLHDHNMVRSRSANSAAVRMSWLREA